MVAIDTQSFPVKYCIKQPKKVYRYKSAMSKVDSSNYEGNILIFMDGYEIKKPLVKSRTGYMGIN